MAQTIGVLLVRAQGSGVLLDSYRANDLKSTV